ncbi:MAG: head-tail connector protein [Xylophilus ampelinus]
MTEYVTTCYCPDGTVLDANAETPAEVVQALAAPAAVSLLAAAVVEEPAVGLVTLARAKRHLRVDGDDEDVDITAMIRAAYRALEGVIFRRIYADADAMGLDLSGVVADEDLNAAALLLIGHLYANRGTEDAAVPRAIQYLVQSHVNCAGGY